MFIDSFDSVHALLTAIDATRKGKKWQRWNMDFVSSVDNKSWSKDYGTLDANVDRARYLTGMDADIKLLDSLTETLAGSVQPPASIRRVPAWGRSGARVNVNRVLSGNLQHAWRRTERQARPSQGNVLTLILTCAFGTHITAEQIRYTSAATLAYASLAEQAGYRVELWSACPSTNTYNPDSDEISCVCLKRASEPWNVQNVAVAMHGGWLRKLMLRVKEMGVTKGYGVLQSHYGYPKQGRDATPFIQRWADQYSIGNWRMGAEPNAHITSEPAAARWIRTQLESLAA